MTGTVWPTKPKILIWLFTENVCCSSCPHPPPHQKICYFTKTALSTFLFVLKANKLKAYFTLEIAVLKLFYNKLQIPEKSL